MKKIKVILVFLLMFLGVTEIKALDKGVEEEVEDGNYYSNVIYEDEEIVNFDYREFEHDLEEEANEVSKLRSRKYNILGINGSGMSTINLYSSNSTSSTRLTYISNSASYNADAALLETKGNWYKIRIAGVTGWVYKTGDMKLYDASTVKGVSHYRVEGNDLIHYISRNVEGDSFSKVNNGPAPSVLKKNRNYYSFDGHYFYTTINRMISDYKVNSTSKAVNKTPFYNYYQFLPIRSESKITANQIDNYLTKKNGFTSLIGRKTNSGIKPHESNLYGSGHFSTNYGLDFGNNHATTMALAIHESGWGRSYIAASKNNMFGHEAYDSYPGAAGTYRSVSNSFHNHNVGYLNWLYLDTVAWMYRGGTLGNKSTGINVFYASDAYWGEKAAQHYLHLDRYAGTQDYGNYQFVVNKNHTINIKKEPSSKSHNISKYRNGRLHNAQLKGEDHVALYLGTFNGETIKGSNKWYRVAVDTLMDSNRNLLVENSSTKEYHFNKHDNYGYVHSSEVNLLSKYSKSNNGWRFYPNTNKWAYRYAPNNWAYGVSKIGNERFLFDKEGYLTSGWRRRGKSWEYFGKNGTNRIGWVEDKGRWYHLDNKGIMSTGWTKVGSSWYYMNSSGVMQTGWNKIRNKWYYMSNSGVMQRGWNKINDKWYYMDSSGAMQTGWNEVANKWYYMNSSGAMETGWTKVKNRWYYMNSSGVMQTGWNKIDNKWYHMNSNGVMQRGWNEVANKWYYMNSSGAMETGWTKVKNRWYYMNSSGVMQTGWRKIKNEWYYMSKSGAMQRGWNQIDNTWYYMNSSGVMQTGWNKVNNRWYYMRSNGAMQTGWRKIRNNWYYMNNSGAMQRGWNQIDNTWYYMNSSGVMQTGWNKVNNRWYYMRSNGAMQTGWRKIRNKWYYLSGSGAMRTGWQQISGDWYYFYDNGVMASNTKIGKYRLSSSGAMI